ncbi:MAG: hypothetical protein Q4B08_07600 [Propionibacteriaceae bacterium]|nr:hypothetical protein [Propionibacteriaceae bacterium]
MDKHVTLLRPQAHKPVRTIRIRIHTTHQHPAGVVRITDTQVQAGSTATGWVPHVTEMPWVVGVRGG